MGSVHQAMPILPILSEKVPPAAYSSSIPSVGSMVMPITVQPIFAGCLVWARMACTALPWASRITRLTCFSSLPGASSM